MSTVSYHLKRSSADERLTLLLKICDIKQSIRDNDTRTLRDISAVCGGDPSSTDAFIAHVDAWLREFRGALSKVALSSGFRSSGLTAALTHASFIGSTGGVENGIIFDELTDFLDPTGVLAGPIEVIKEKVNALQSVSGASTKAQLRVSNFSRPSAIESALSSTTSSKQRIELGETTLTGGNICQSSAHTASANNYVGREAQIFSTATTARSTLVGPRLVYTGVSDSDDLRVRVRGGLAHAMTVGNPSALRMVTSRFAIVGTARSDVHAGALGGLFRAPTSGNSITNSGTDTGVCLIPDTDMAILQNGPTLVTADPAANSNPATAAAGTNVQGVRSGTMFASAQNYGLVADQIVLIPMSGLEDSRAAVDGMPVGQDHESLVSITMASISPASTVQVVGSSALNSGYEHTVNVKQYLEMARAVKAPTTDYDTIMFVDLVSVLEHGGPTVAGSTASTGSGADADIHFVGRFSLTGEASMAAPPASYYSTVSEDRITGNVRALRRSWDDSSVMGMLDGYDTFAARDGSDPVTDRAFSELVATRYLALPSTVDDTFIKTLVTNESLANADRNSKEKVFEKLQNATVTSKYVDPLDPNNWIGPNHGSARSRIIAADAKEAMYKKWSRVMDYLLLIAKMDLKWSDSAHA